MSRSAHQVHRLLADGGTSRLVLWFWILVWAVDISTDDLTSGARWTTWAAGALFLAWDIARSHLGRLAALPGVLLVLGGLALINGDLVIAGRVAAAWGIAILAVSLPWRLALPTSLLSFGAVIWLAATLAPASALPAYVLGLLSHILLPFLLLRISITARRLRNTQEELARTEVDAERDRLAEELNALIGQTLNQVGHQVSEARSAAGHRNPDLQAQLADVDVLVQRGLDQLRLLSHEPVVDDLDTEVHTAHTLCNRLGVGFTAAVDEVDDVVNRTFALLLRESVTNMFKHAIPTRCTVVARTQDGEALFSFTNDGADEDAKSGRRGSGQGRWRAVVTEVGGTLETGPLGGGRYRVLARVPLDTEVTATIAASDSLERNTHHA